MLAMTYKLIQVTSKNWIGLVGCARFGQLITGVRFIDGISELESKQNVTSHVQEAAVLAA